MKWKHRTLSFAGRAVTIPTKWSTVMYIFFFSFSFFGTPLCFKATCEDLYLCNHVTIRGGTLLALYVPLLNFLWSWRTRWGAVINSLHVPLHKWNGIETQVQPEMKAKWDRLPFIWKGVCLNEGNAPLKIQSKKSKLRLMLHCVGQV